MPFFDRCLTLFDQGLGLLERCVTRAYLVISGALFVAFAGMLYVLTWIGLLPCRAAVWFRKTFLDSWQRALWTLVMVMLLAWVVGFAEVTRAYNQGFRDGEHWNWLVHTLSSAPRPSK